MLRSLPRSSLIRTSLSAALLASLLSLGTCGLYQRDPVTRLLTYLPRDQALHLYADLEGIHSSASLGPWLRKALEAGSDFNSLLKQIGIEDPGDLDALALSIGVGEVFAVSRGRFQEEQWQDFVRLQCGTPKLQTPCIVKVGPESHDVSILALGADLRAVAYGPPPEAVAQRFDGNSPGAEFLAPAGRERLEGGAYVWLTVDPALLDRAMQDPPAGMTNLTLLARALAKAERGYLFLRNDSTQNLSVHLEAQCATAAAASEVHGLLVSLNQFAAAAVNFGRGETTPSEWTPVLESVQFRQIDSRVEGVWLIDPALLEKALGER